jgi:hypothetical protein
VDDNLFLRLHAWASGQDENFVTESFAYLLRHLLRHEVGVGVGLLEWLTGGRMRVGQEEAQSVSVSTQTTVEGKRPDIEIATPGWLVYVEVKVASSLGFEQLANYRARLNASGVEHTALVLLTRYEPWVAEGQTPDVSIRWYQVASWLEKELRSGSLTNALSLFVVEQFYGFLRGRRMTIGHVDKELQRGVPALVSLMTMLRHALVGHGLIVRDNMRWQDWFGFEVVLGGATAYYIGVYAHEPTLMRCRTWAVQVDPEKAEALGKGRLWRQSGRLRWENMQDLVGEGTDFYDLSTDGQMIVLSNFVASCIEMVKEITITGGVTEVSPSEGEAEGS